MRTLKIACTAVAIGAVVSAAASAQRPNRRGMEQYFGSSTDFYQPPAWGGNPEYDGRFTFARIKYRGWQHMTQEGPGWSHDYPDAEENFSKILRDITFVRPFVEQGRMFGGVIVALDDPMLFKYPVSYMSEPGGWMPNDTEIAAFRSYLLKGGFMIFDDFREGWQGNYDFSHLRQQMARAIPNARWVQMTGKEPIFDSFFKIDFNAPLSGTSAYGVSKPTFWGVYQDNDPKKRLILIANVDNDIGESWQHSATGFVPIAAANETYKLGVNYVIYALTH